MSLTHPRFNINRYVRECYATGRKVPAIWRAGKPSEEDDIEDASSYEVAAWSPSSSPVDVKAERIASSDEPLVWLKATQDGTQLWDGTLRLNDADAFQDVSQQLALASGKTLTD